MGRHRGRLLYVLAGTVVALGLVPAPPQRLAAAVTSAPESTDPAELTRFVRQLAKDHQVPGAVVTIVGGGRVVDVHGIGVTDRRTGSPVLPETCFHLGSISKVFTATAVMRLAEEGRVDLHTDVNQYLRAFTLASRGRPITLHDLLTHSAGLEQRGVATATTGPQGWQPLGRHLRDHPPEAMFPPGRRISYSSVGIAVAGQVVADVTGMPFDRYLETAVFAPLGMTASTFPTPQRGVPSNCAVGYSGDRAWREPYFSLVGPGGDALSTGADMGRFMLSQLGGPNPVLSRKSVTAMQAQQFSHHPDLRGRGYGWSRWYEQGQTAVFHNGQAPGFLSRMVLVPGHRLGIFLAASDGGSAAADFLRDASAGLLAAYFPQGRNQRLPDGPPVTDVEEHTGYYRDPTLPADSFTRIVTLLTATRVTADGDDLRIDGERYRSTPRNGLPVYEGPGEDDRVLLDDGWLLLGSASLQRMPWWESPPVQLGIVGVIAAGSLAALVGALAGALRRRRPVTVRRWLAAGLGAANLGFLIGFPVVAGAALSDPSAILYGIPTPIAVLLGLPVVSAALTVAAAAIGIHAARQSGEGRGRLSGYTLFVLLNVAYLGWLASWHLLGWQH
jgi:CubicO group peptidase (beta-lactamase class C family)